MTTASSSSSKVARRPVTVSPSVGTRSQQNRSSSRPPISTSTAPTTQPRQSTAPLHNATTTEATRQRMLINVASKRSKKSISSSISPLLFQLERNYLAFLSWQQEWSTQRASTAARNDPRPVLLALVQDFFHSHNQNRIKQQRQAAQPLSANTPLLTMTCTCAEGLWYSAPPETLAVDQSLRSLTDKLAPIVNRQNQTRSAASQDLPLVGDVLRALSSHYLLRTTEKSAREGDDSVNDTISWLATMLGRYLQQEITRAISSPCAMIDAAGLFPSCDYCRTAAELMRLCRAFPSAGPRPPHCSAQVEWYCFLTTVLLRTPPSSTTSFDSQLLLDLPCSVLVKFFDQQFVKCDRTVPDTVPQRSLYIRLLYRVGRAAQKWLAMPVSGVVAPSRPRLSQKLSTAYTQWMKERLSTFATSALCPSSPSSLHSVPHYVLVMQRNLDLGNEVVTTAQFQEALAALQKRVLTAAAPSLAVAVSKRSAMALPTTQQNLQRKGAVATVVRRRPPAKRRRRQETSSDESEEEDTTSSSSSESEDDEEERPVAHRHLQPKTTTTTAPPAKKPRTTGAPKALTRSGSPKVLSEDETLAAVFAKGTPMRAQRKK